VKRNFRKTIALISLLAGAEEIYAQGLINWADYTTDYSISIISPNPGQPFVEQTGNTSWDLPPGNADYAGGWIGGNDTAPGGGVGPTPANGPGGYNYQIGSDFEVGLYVATSLEALTSAIWNGTPVAITSIYGGGNAGLYGADGSGPIVAVPNIAAGTPVFVGIAAWYSGRGASNYVAAVETAVPCDYVESISSVVLGTQGDPPNIPDLSGIGLTSFNLAVSLDAPPPVVSTEPATSITAYGATLNATVEYEGDGFNFLYFAYGTTTNYGSVTGAATFNGTNTFSQNIAGLLPDTLYHFQVFASSYESGAIGGDLTFTTLPIIIGAPPTLTGAQLLGAGSVRFSFTNNPNATFTVLSTTNLSLPLNSWTAVGSPTNIGSGVFQFTSQPTTNDATRFYAIRSP
jgi:hypothetical protein